MTRDDAIKIITDRIRIDRDGILADGEPESDFDKFVAEQDDALDMALQALKDPVSICDGFELRVAYEKQQHLYDTEDIEMKIDSEYDTLCEKYSIDEKPVQKDEIEEMANLLRHWLNNDADATWSVCCNDAVCIVLNRRGLS